MENEMIKLFLIVLWLTFLIVKILSSILHDKKNYGTIKEKSKTITGILRKKTEFDWHHIHFGIIILIISLITILIYKINNFNIIFLAIGLSLISDQLFPLLNYGDYFSERMIMAAIILNLLISLLTIMIF